CEIRNVDCFLHLSFPLNEDLPHLHRHETPERLLKITQGISEIANKKSSLRRRHLAPFTKGLPRLFDNLVVRLLTRDKHFAKTRPINWRKGFQYTLAFGDHGLPIRPRKRPRRIKPKITKNIFHNPHLNT